MKTLVKFNSILLILFFALTLSSCLDLEESVFQKQAAADDLKIQKYLSDNHIEAMKDETGFYYERLTPQDPGGNYVGLHREDVVDFRYKISLLDGTVIEDSLNSKKPLKFKLLDSSILPQALDRGICYMVVGSKFRFYIPSYLAYGDYRSSKIPSRSNLIVEVQVTRKQSETDLEQAQLDSIDHYVKSKYTGFEKSASGLYYISTLTGTGNSPHLGDRIKINMTRRYLDGTVIKTVQDLTLDLGFHQAVPGLEEGILKMKTGGKAILVMPSSIAFEQSLCLVPQMIRSELLEDKLISAEVLPYSIVEYEVELKGGEF